MKEQFRNALASNDRQDQLQLDAMTQENFLQQDVRGRNVLHLAFEKENPACLIEFILQKAGVFSIVCNALST